eukprot:scaffold122038_cov64-Phaeocystis_antarctica.AAC.4
MDEPECTNYGGWPHLVMGLACQNRSSAPKASRARSVCGTDRYGVSTLTLTAHGHPSTADAQVVLVRLGCLWCERHPDQAWLRDRSVPSSRNTGFRLELRGLYDRLLRR